MSKNSIDRMREGLTFPLLVTMCGGGDRELVIPAKFMPESNSGQWDGRTLEYRSRLGNLRERGQVMGR